MVWIFFPLVAGILLAVAAYYYVAYVRDKSRTQAFEQLAPGLKMRFDAEAAEIRPLFSGFELFHRGHFHRAERLLIGGEGPDEICVFDYRFTVRRGNQSHTTRQTVAAFRALPVDLPEFQVRPERLFHKIGTSLGYQDIDLDEHPEFSKRYLLRGQSEDEIRELFRASIIETIMGLKPLCVEGDGRVLLVYRLGRRVKPNALNEFIDEARDVQAAFLDKKRPGVRYRLT